MDGKSKNSIRNSSKLNHASMEFNVKNLIAHTIIMRMTKNSNCHNGLNIFLRQGLLPLQIIFIYQYWVIWVSYINKLLFRGWLLKWIVIWYYYKNLNKFPKPMITITICIPNKYNSFNSMVKSWILNSFRHNNSSSIRVL